jgi:ppGpp synthetase/RelA/SpoT-type nucleotidyltranferase
MAWAVPQYPKNKVNWAGERLVEVVPVDDTGAVEHESLMAYFEALDIINNWRSSHNFPLNTFHVGLRKRARLIDSHCVTAQRIKRLSSIEAKLHRFPTMTLSQMQDIGGCRAIVGNRLQVEEVASSYLESEIKHTRTQTDNYIEKPKDSGYRGIHLIYRYYSDKKPNYNTLKIEVQLRSQLQHAWATAVETVGAFIQQALKSSIGEADWLRFFALMGSAIAIRERAPLVPNTPVRYVDLVNELRSYARDLDIANKLTAFGTALNVFESPQTRNNHYFLVELNPATKFVNVTGFKQAESDRATAKYLEVEKKIKQGSSQTDAVLVSVDSIAALRRAYPNYFLDTKVFVDLMNETLRTLRPPRRRPGQLSLFRD